jgi:hypothetical protein
MTEEFLVWYKKYIIVCNTKYTAFIEDLLKKFETEKEQAQKLLEARMKYSDLTAESGLDQKILQNEEKLANLEYDLEKAKSIKQEMNERLLEDSASKVYNKIIEHPKVTKIEIDDKTLNVYTKKLKVEGSNIGDFKLSYQLDKILYIKNLEYVVDNKYDHWHIQFGEPCLSEWKPILWRQLDTFQLFFFVDTLIHYLLLSSSVHAYISFKDWIKKFEAKEKLEEIQEKTLRATDLTESQLAYFREYNDAVQTIVSDHISADWIRGNTISANAGWNWYAITTTSFSS